MVCSLYTHRLWLFIFSAVSVLCFFPFFNIVFADDGPAEWSKKSGPIFLVNQSPIQLLFFQPLPDRAETPGDGHGSIRLTTNLTNTLLSKSSSHFEAALDMEHIRTCLNMRYGVGSMYEISFTLPILHFYSGILDSFIYDVEKLSGNVRGIRELEKDLRTQNSFTYNVKKDGNLLITGYDNKTGFGDAVLAGKALLFEQEGWLPSMALRASVKLPTGSKSKAFGSGEYDFGIGVLLEEDFCQLSLYLNADASFPSEPFEDQGVSLREFYTVMFGAEYRFNSQFSLLSQMYYITRPFEHTGVDLLDKRIWDLLVGVNYRTKLGLFFQGGLSEDIIDSADASADITFFLNIGKYF